MRRAPRARARDAGARATGAQALTPSSVVSRAGVLAPDCALPVLLELPGLRSQRSVAGVSTRTASAHVAVAAVRIAAPRALPWLLHRHNSVAAARSRLLGISHADPNTAPPAPAGERLGSSEPYNRRAVPRPVRPRDPPLHRKRRCSPQVSYSKSSPAPMRSHASDVDTCDARPHLDQREGAEPLQIETRSVPKR